MLGAARHKLLKFWVQSFLANVPTIVVGLRDDNGFLRAVETLETLKLPRLVRGKAGMWVCAPARDPAGPAAAAVRSDALAGRGHGGKGGRSAMTGPGGLPALRRAVLCLAETVDARGSRPAGGVARRVHAVHR